MCHSRSIISSQKDDELWDELCVGDKVVLVRHRENKYDSNAVAVALADDYDGNPDNFDFDFILGYLLREINADIAAMMDAEGDDLFEAEISSYKRYGAYNDRIHITIWLLSNETKVEQNDRLRMQSLDIEEYLDMINELRHKGFVHFRWRTTCFPSEIELNTPQLGDEIVLLNQQNSNVVLYLVKVIATDEDCLPFLDFNLDAIRRYDDCSSYILSNIAGPLTTNLKVLHFLDTNTLNERSVHNFVSKRESRNLKDLFWK